MTTDRRDLGAIIPSYLDDYPLTPYEFRVYARIARRVGKGGECNERNRRIGDAIGMSESAVRDAKALLQACRLVDITPRPGRPDSVALLHADEWAPQDQVAQLREETRAARRRTPGTGPGPSDGTGAGTGPAHRGSSTRTTPGTGPAPTEGVQGKGSKEGEDHDDGDDGAAADPSRFPTRTPTDGTYVDAILAWWETRGEELPRFSSLAHQYRYAIQVAAAAGPHDPSRQRPAWTRFATTLVAEYLQHSVGADTPEPSATSHLQRMIASRGAEFTIAKLEEAVMRGAGLGDEWAAAPQRAVVRYAGAIIFGGREPRNGGAPG